MYPLFMSITRCTEPLPASGRATRRTYTGVAIPVVSVECRPGCQITATLAIIVVNIDAAVYAGKLFRAYGFPVGILSYSHSVILL